MILMTAVSRAVFTTVFLAWQHVEAANIGGKSEGSHHSVFRHSSSRDSHPAPPRPSHYAPIGMPRLISLQGMPVQHADPAVQRREHETKYATVPISMHLSQPHSGNPSPSSSHDQASSHHVATTHLYVPPTHHHDVREQDRVQQDRAVTYHAPVSPIYPQVWPHGVDYPIHPMQQPVMPLPPTDDTPTTSLREAANVIVLLLLPFSLSLAIVALASVLVSVWKKRRPYKRFCG
ncbi:unnamed protein product [Vitrella brassicaformis CCMP3155]|uniref:Uncharacterized protein n=1 Tax=Vitrella brassicaformis (strain CCMP3155) TaxID=1169540 RepID=A0A0G4EQK9_VITBC|nr:unnamed protein product [Vitrella brassicaformis CCMP3155]|eukprot:CEL99752.1 unnamed protein product [Vitrella brassicaformis CCMP3155]